jgi:hypothetical protein
MKTEEAIDFDNVLSKFERVSEKIVENIEIHLKIVNSLRDKIESFLKDDLIAPNLHQRREFLFNSLQIQVQLNKDEIDHQIEQAKKKNNKTNKSKIRNMIFKRIGFVYLHQPSIQNDLIRMGSSYFGNLKKSNFDLTFFLKYNHLLDHFSTKYFQTQKAKCVLNVRVDSNRLIEIYQVEKDYYEVQLINLIYFKVINSIRFTFAYEFSDVNIKLKVSKELKRVLIIKRENISFLLELYDLELNLINKNQLSRSVLPLHSNFELFLNKNELIFSLSSCSYLLVYDMSYLRFKEFLGQDKKRNSGFYLTTNKHMVQVKNDNIVYIDSDPVNLKIKFLNIMSRETGFIKNSIKIGRESTGKIIIDLLNEQIAIEKFDDSMEDRLYFELHDFKGEQFFKTKSYPQTESAKLCSESDLFKIPCSVRNFELSELINN